MRLRVVHLSLEGLTDAEVLLMTSGDKHPLAAVEDHNHAVIVRIDAVEKVPSPLFVVFSRRRGHKPQRVATHYGQLAIGIEDAVAGPRNVQVRHPFSLNLL